MTGLFRKRKRSVGVDLGTALLKVVEVDHSGDLPEVVGIHVEALPIGPAGGEGIVESQAAASLLEGVLHAISPRPRPAFVGAVGGHDVMIKTISMDRMREEEVREVIRWEAEQHVPFDIRNVELDFQILDPAGETSRMEVLLVAAKREIVEARTSFFRAAGMEPDIIDIEAFALCNGFSRNHPEALQGVVALLNIGAEKTDLILIEDGAPILARQVGLGADRLEKEQEAEPRGEGEWEDVAGMSVGSIVREGSGPRGAGTGLVFAAEELARAVERAASFLLARETDRALGSVYLSGGGARTGGLAEEIGARLGVRSEVVRSFDGVRVHPEAMTGASLKEVGPLVLLALGLALREEGSGR